MQGVVMFLFIFLIFAKLEIVRSNIVSVDNNDDDDNYESCPEDETSYRRVGGGNFAQLGQFPYQAGIYIVHHRLYLCGGSLISSTRIISAAHCWCIDDEIAKGAKVTLGSLHMNHGGIKIFTDKFVIHPEWDRISRKNDVAVVYLPHAVTFSSTIAPIALPSESELGEDFIHSKAVASGYGINGKDNCTQPLSYTFLEIVPNSQCEMTYKEVPETIICATSFWGEKSTCEGDSGGPLVVMKNNKPILIGISSFSGGICPTEDPTGYTRITDVMPFINQHL